MIVRYLACGALENFSGNNAWTGTVTLNTDNAIATTAGTLTVSGAIDGAYALTKTGTGTLTLSGANSYSGSTTISAGLLKLGAAGSGANTPLGTNAAGTVVSSGAALDLAGYTLSAAEALTLNGTGISDGGALMNSGSAATYSGLVTLGSTGVSIVGGTGTIALSNAGTITGSGFNLTLDGAQGGSVASIIGTDAGTLTKSGSGTWTLTGANTYTGATTLSAGTLALGGSGAIGASAVSVNGGTFAPGGVAAADSTNALGSTLTLETGGTVHFDLSTPQTPPTAGGDQLQVSGAVALGGALTVNALAGFGVGTYRLITCSGTPTGTFATINMPGGYDGAQSLGSGYVDFHRERPHP